MASSDDHAATGPSQELASHSASQAMTVESNGLQKIEPSTDNQAKYQNIILCGICETQQSKYKCPRCSLPYCSVACNKIHRENHPADPDPAPRPTSPPQLLPVDVYFRGDKQAGPFQILEQSEQLQFLFNKYPRLRSQLLDIHAATLEPTSAKSKIPASLLKDLPSNGGGWNPEKGIASGKEALRKARTVAGEDGEAIREYSELVLHIMDKSNSKANG